MHAVGRPLGKDKMACCGAGFHGACGRSSPARLFRNRHRALRHKLCFKLRAVLDSGCNTKGCHAVAHEPGVPSEEVSFAEGYAAFLTSFVEKSKLPFARAAVSGEFRGPKPARRDLFPLPRLRSWPACIAEGEQNRSGLLACADLCCAALNHLSDGMPETSGSRLGQGCTAAQRAVQEHVCQRVVRFCTRLNSTSDGPFSYKGSLQTFGRNSAGYERIRGGDVDLPTRAATCDPGNLVHPGLWETICRPGAIFEEHQSFQQCLGFTKTFGIERKEYIDLTCRELRCKKLRLRTQVFGVAGVFAAAKSTKGRQRKIWDGSVLSERATQPPKPHRLANPSSFLDIVVRRGERLYMSKRDAATYFDLLAVPADLQPWFGQEPIALHEFLSQGGFALAEVIGFVDDLPQGEGLLAQTLLFPVHAAWPMGFSWSSCVAQSNTIGLLVDAGVDPRCILSLDHTLPGSQEELCAVATDDTLFFHRCPFKGRRTLSKLDKVFDKNGVARNVNKDISLAAEMTALGCDISAAPPLVEPCKRKLVKFVAAVCDLLEAPTASPVVVNSVLGTAQWFCLLQRSLFSIFNAIYRFVQLEPSWKPALLPAAVKNELLVCLVLSPLLPAALDRPFLSELLACDAAPQYGFGVCSLACGRKVVEEVGRYAERRGDYVRLQAAAGDEPEVPRLGVPRRLPFCKGDFKPLISTRAKWPAHSGVLECHGVLLTVKWVCRSRSRQGHRVVILVDAKAAIGSISKGRSSAGSLRRVLRNIAAHTLACNLLLRLVYIPSESNPADDPSRGKRAVHHVKRNFLKTSRRPMRV